MLAFGPTSLIRGFTVKKWLVAVLIALALLLLVAPGIVGRLAEQNIEENIDWAEGDSPGVNIRTERFERGWFTSAGVHRVVLEGGQFAEATLAYRESTGNNELPSLVITTDMAHGLLPGGSLRPGLASTVSTFQIDPGNGELIDIPGRLTSNVGLAGDSDSRLLLEAGTHQIDDAAIEWQGMDMNFISNPGPGTMAVEGEISPWRIAVDDTTVDVAATSIKADQVRSDYGFNVGTFDLEMGRVEVIEDGMPFSINSVSLTGDTSIEDDRLNARSAFAVNTMAIPAVGDVSLDVDFDISGADAAASGAIAAVLQEAQSAPDPEAALANVYPQIEDDLGTLFAKGFTVNMDKFDVTLPQGTVSLAMDISMPVSDAGGPVNWSSVLLQMNGTLDVRIPASIFQMAAMFSPEAGQMIAMGILVQDGEDYVMNAEYAQGLFNVNGTPMPIPLPQ